MRTMRMLAASVVGAACVVAAAPANTARAVAVPTLTITCHQNPSGCDATGAIGNLIARAILSPKGDEVFVCLGDRSGACGAATAILTITPRGVFGVAGVGGVLAQVVIVPKLLAVDVFSGSFLVQLVASNGAEGVVVLTSKVHACLLIQGLKITAPDC